MRPNAITLTGPPIEHMPTKKIFAYVAHYADSPPSALEWVNDTTAVIVYETNKKARATFAALMREEKPIPEDNEELTLSHKVPQELWPAQLRIDNLLGERADASGLAGDIQFRWASTNDVKKKGASRDSNFYHRYGETAGKEGRPNRIWDARQSKRGRTEGWSDSEDGRWKHDRSENGHDREGGRRQPVQGRARPTKSDLDAELEAFAHDRDDRDS